MTGLRLVIGNKNYSSWSFRAWLYLKESGVAFQEVRVPLHTPQWEREIPRLSPSGRVPVLWDGDVAVWDTAAIFETLREKIPGAIGWPADPRARAVARSVSAEMHSGFLALREEMPFNCRRHITGIAFGGDALEDVERVKAIWGGCRREFGAGGPWLFGGISVADVMFSAVALRFRTYGIDLGGEAGIFSEALLALSSVQRWLEDAAAEEEVIPAYERQPCS